MSALRSRNRGRNRRRSSGRAPTVKSDLDSLAANLRAVRRELITQPMTVAAPLVVPCHRRFQSAASSGGTGNALYGAYFLELLKMGVNNTSAYRLLVSVRIKRVEMWSQVTVSSTSGTPTQSVPVGFQWGGTSWSPTLEMIDNSVGEQSSHLVTSPPRGSAGSEWIVSGGQFDSGNSSSSLIAKIYGNEGTLVDIWFDFVFRGDQTSATICTFLTTGYVAGQLYYGNLDATSANWAPVGSLNVL